jgi:anaerobic magnesium-protoporphyrin IX monomethyl ester cyclase
MKVLLIHPASGMMEFAERFYIPIDPYLPPLGILYIASMLEKNDHTVTIIDCNAEQFTRDICKKALNECDAVGMTLYCEPIEQNNSIFISNIIREIDTDIPLIVGGPHSTLLPEKSLADHKANICVKGRGETIINPIIDAIQGKKNFSAIPNIAYKENGKVIHTETVPVKMSYDHLPYPSRHLVNKYDYGYINGHKLAKGRLASIITSRGCANRCHFCNLHAHVKDCTFRSVEYIEKEIEDISNKGYKTLAFVDDNFMMKKKTVLEIIEFIINNKFDFHIWIFGARAAAADRVLFKKMHDAGTEIISFGIESGSQQVLNYYNKKLTIPEIIYAVNLAKEMDIITTGTFIIGSPIETRDDINKTIQFASHLPLDAAIFFMYNYTYKSKIWQDAVDDGKIQPTDFRVFPDKRRGLGNFTPEELFFFTKIANVRFFFNPKRWLRTMIRAVKSNDFRMCVQGYEMVKKIMTEKSSQLNFDYV